MQTISDVVIDADGRPVCSQMWPGNTADVGVLVSVASAGSASSTTAA